jgi:hypothetical protein
MLDLALSYTGNILFQTIFLNGSFSHLELLDLARRSHWK